MIFHTMCNDISLCNFIDFIIQRRMINLKVTKLFINSQNDKLKFLLIKIKINNMRLLG